MQSQHLGDERYRALFEAHCDVVVPMNELKFGLVHPERERYDFGPADALIAFASRHNKRLRGHALAWHTEIPDWLRPIDDPREAERVFRAHVETVVGRYSGRIESWDAVNEAIEYGDPGDPALRADSYWQRVLGPRHIPLAFEAAAAVDSQAKLVLNDYDLEFLGPRYRRRRAVALEIVQQLRDANLRIDGVGIQGHLYADQRIDVDALAKFGEDLKALGVELLVTELDVIDWKIGGGPGPQDEAAARIVADFLDGVFAAGPPEAVIAWGLTDRYSWIDDVMPHADGTPSRPLPFDRDYRSKPWFDALQRRLGRTGPDGG